MCFYAKLFDKKKKKTFFYQKFILQFYKSVDVFLCKKINNAQKISNTTKLYDFEFLFLLPSRHLKIHYTI